MKKSLKLNERLKKKTERFVDNNQIFDQDFLFHIITSDLIF